MQTRLTSRSLHLAVRPLTALWRDLVGAWRFALARRQGVDLDDATLRDLGIARAELSSFRAEAEGRAERTRLRVFALHVTVA